MDGERTMDSEINQSRAEKENWFAAHPTVSIVTYTITVAAAVFAVAKFILIDSIEINYQSQIDSQQTIIEQYQARIDFLEWERESLESERDRYFDCLKDIPGSIYYLENKIKLLEDENSKLREAGAASQLQEKYYTEYSNIKKNNSVIDSYTGIVICMNSIDTSSGGLLSMTLPQQETEIIAVKAGDVLPFSIGNKEFQLIISSIGWISDTYSVTIREL